MSDPAPTDAQRTPNPLLAACGRALEEALNRLVDLDAETKTRLAALDGRAVTLEFRQTSLAMRIAVDGTRLRVGPAFAADSALRVSTTPAALLALALMRGEGASPGRVDIAGDAELARRLEQILTRFAPDFDEACARAFGDVAGYPIARAVRAALAWSRSSAQTLARNTTEFLSEESRDLVAHAELGTFLDEVDALRERTDRLDARVRRLRTAHGTAGV
jgi:ubiquinone biosynthesis protein UbiJ